MKYPMVILWLSYGYPTVKDVRAIGGHLRFVLSLYRPFRRGGYIVDRFGAVCRYGFRQKMG